jgi:hypothetical protein
MPDGTPDLHRIADGPWRGAWDDDDPDANFKRDVAERTRTDPMQTLATLSGSTGIPVDALARYALVRWASEGSDALLALGPRTVERMWAVLAEAEEADSDAARLEAYDVLRQMVSWLRAPLASDDHQRDRDEEHPQAQEH